MRSRVPALRPCGVLAATALLALGAGCGSSADEDGAGGGAAGSSTTSSTDSSTSPSPSPEAVPTPTSYPPADGGRIKVPGASMHALATYKHLTDYGIAQGWNDGQSAVTFAPSLTSKTSLDAFAKEWINEHGGPKVQVRQDDAVAGGKYSAWHVIDTTSDPSEIAHQFGIMFLDSAWVINVRIYLPGVPETLTEEEQAEVIGRLLASFKTDLD